MPIVTPTMKSSCSLPGECMCCTRVSFCALTDAQKVLSSFTCTSFNPVPEAEWRARIAMMKKFGDALAVDAMLTTRSKP